MQPDVVAQVVINERTGTVVLGQDVSIATVAVAHGSLSVRIQSKPEVSQPPTFSPGETVVTTPGHLGGRRDGRSGAPNRGPASAELVEPLDAIGATPRDIIAILQSLKSRGPLWRIGGDLSVLRLADRPSSPCASRHAKHDLRQGVNSYAGRCVNPYGRRCDHRADYFAPFWRSTWSAKARTLLSPPGPRRGRRPINNSMRSEWPCRVSKHFSFNISCRA